MDARETERLVRAIHAVGRPLVLAVTGGGSPAIGALLTVPGASRTVWEAAVPYSDRALAAWLGARPERACSATTARATAMVGYRKACKYEAADPLGVACTASLASDRPKRGPHRAHVAVQSARTTLTQSIELAKGARSRADEENLVALLILNSIAEACGVEARLSLPLVEGEVIERTETAAPLAWQMLLAGELEAVCREAGADSTAPPAPGLVVFPGAFNPLHVGHRHMARVAANELGKAVHFELSIENVDKPPLDFTAMQTRVAQFSAGEPLWLTRAATFVEKARLFSQATFLVGVDTLVRIGDARYYGGQEKQRDAALASLADRGCGFLVFGRQGERGFLTLDRVELPQTLRKLCRGIPASAFREDISSTELRRARGE